MIILNILVLLIIHICGSCSKIFEIKNVGTKDLWIGSQSLLNQSSLNNGGWHLKPDDKVEVVASEDWYGYFWGRLYPFENYNKEGHCNTKKETTEKNLECNETKPAPPVTLVHFNLAALHPQQYYFVSLIEGFNLKAMIIPLNEFGEHLEPCRIASCYADLIQNCPKDLLAKNGEIGCHSPCTAFKTDQYCCEGKYRKYSACDFTKWPVNYIPVFKEHCPNSLIYVFDLYSGVHLCDAYKYSIRFSN